MKIINQTRVTKKVKRPILVKQKVSKTNQQVVVKGELKRKSDHFGGELVVHYVLRSGAAAPIICV